MRKPAKTRSSTRNKGVLPDVASLLNHAVEKPRKKRDTNKIVVSPSLTEPRVLEAAEELKLRRTARKSLIRLCEHVHPKYQANWHHRVIAEYFEKMCWGKLDVDGIMAFAPPRHGKSDLFAVHGPAWDLGERPSEHWRTLAYGDDLANTFSRGCRNIIAGPKYQRLWRHRFKIFNDTRWELVRKDDDQRASYIAAGILSAITGEGATRLLIDDPLKNAEEAYSKKIRDKVFDNYLTAASTRMSPRGKKFWVMTRWHEDDPAGRVIKAALKDKKAEQWLILVFAATNDTGENSYIWNTKTGEKKYFPPYKALWPEWYPRDVLDKMQATMGSVFWNALYMQRPMPATGGIFKRENWGYFDGRPVADLLVQIVDGACEQGQENDYSASITMAAAGNIFPIYDAWRDKVTFPYLMAKIYERWEMSLREYQRYPDRLLVENKSSGIQIRQQIETNNLSGMWTFPNGETKKVPAIPVLGVPANQSKMLRAQGVSGYHESKLVLLPRGADWLEDFIDELALFDKGPHDDFVDCVVHGLIYYTRPVEEQEEIVVSDDDVVIDSDLDEYELRQELGSW